MIEIKSKKDCCGCTACVAVCSHHCISMCEDEEGFLYPKVDVRACVDCGLCERVCPVLNQKTAKYPQSVYAAINPDEDIREKSSSGGIFTMLAERVLQDGGVVFGAKFNDAWNIVHDYCESVDGLADFRGSKYVQSAMGDCYAKAKSFLKQGRKVLFSGTPCQIAGLHNFLRKDYEGLLTIDVVCHGVPSPLVWRSYLEGLKKRPQGVAGKNTVLSSLKAIPVVTGISFRDKHDGWKKFGFSVRGHAASAACQNSVFPSNDQILFREFFGENLFMRGFLSDIILRPSCYACPAKKGKSDSDITLADYWGIENQHPEIDDNKGTSLVLIHTDKGQKAFEELSCKYVASSYNQALQGNSSIEQSVKEPNARRFYLRALQNTPNNPLEALSCALNKVKTKPSLWDKLSFNIRRVVK